MEIVIDAGLVQRLIAEQFPKWKDLPVRPVTTSGWDNRTFHLGEEMLVRLPSAECYAAQVEKEQKFLPVLSPHLPVSIPKPLALGKPSLEPPSMYPWNWSIYGWIKGESVESFPHVKLASLAEDTAQFLSALHAIDTEGGPPPGEHNFHRGGSLSVYDGQTRKALSVLGGKIDGVKAEQLWTRALNTSWKKPPVWVHGDLSAGNLLLDSGQLTAVIDFGCMAVGDPACDLSCAWTLFAGKSREIFQRGVDLDKDIWARARGWTLWKALIVAAGFSNPGNKESQNAWQIIHTLLQE